VNKIERKEMDRLQHENANLRYRLMESEKYHKKACRAVGRYRRAFLKCLKILNWEVPPLRNSVQRITRKVKK
jgi:hypothetical protein